MKSAIYSLVVIFMLLSMTSFAQNNTIQKLKINKLRTQIYNENLGEMSSWGEWKGQTYFFWQIPFYAEISANSMSINHNLDSTQTKVIIEQIYKIKNSDEYTSVFRALVDDKRNGKQKAFTGTCIIKMVDKNLYTDISHYPDKEYHLLLQFFLTNSTPLMNWELFIEQ